MSTLAIVCKEHIIWTNLWLKKQTMDLYKKKALDDELYSYTGIT